MILSISKTYFSSKVLEFYFLKFYIMIRIDSIIYKININIRNVRMYIFKQNIKYITSKIGEWIKEK